MIAEFWNSRPIRKLRKDRWAMLCLAVIVVYALAALGVGLDIFATDYDVRIGAKYLLPFEGEDWKGWLGTDRQGRSILVRALYSTKIAFQVGFVVALVSTLIGGVLGGIAGYFGKWVDDAIVWLYSTIQSIPNLLLLIAISYVAGKGLFGIYLSFCATFWVGTCRVVRGEVLKLREAEYVQAARSMGYGPWRILLRHVMPNTLHLLLVNFALLFVGAIKSEVILSYLGLGVQGEPSWGVMINQAKEELINGFYWQIGAATVFMFGLVLCFNIFSDALSDALDPKAL
jgi:peptide/nickel transport system permease protein